MADFDIGFIGTPKQVTNTSPTCKVNILFQILGPHSGIDLVQVYAIPAGQTVSNGLGNVVDSVDLTITEFQYSSTVDLPAGTSFTIGLCPRSKTGDTLDDQTEGEYWETFCIFESFTTKLTPEIGAPSVTVSSIEPFTLNHPNQLKISWSASDYTDGQVLWGALNNPRANVYSWKPASDQFYNGDQTFVIPSSLQGQILSFTVQVMNSFNDATLWFPTTIGVLSARNYRSVRGFLQASNVRFPTGVKQFLRGAHSLRGLMQI